MDFIDYSQYKNWCRCPWYWFERYVTQVRKKREGQHRDAMTLGSLVHNGLYNWTKQGLPIIDEATMLEMEPTPDCLSAANDLVQEYVRLYPNEDWDMHRFEEPLQFPLFGNAVGEMGGKPRGLAKVDAYFHNPAQREIESGLPGYQLSLQPGWWIREYKTKDATFDRAKWNLGWEINMQAAFQMLALQHKIGEPVQGVLISVLEKPRMYVPKRKCKGCGEQFEMGLFIPTGTGEHACPSCGGTQKLTAYEPKVRSVPQFYRVVAVRDQAQLAQAKKEIVITAIKMQTLEEGGFTDTILAPDREACVHPIYGMCEYFNLHVKGVQPEDDEMLEKHDATRYVGLPEVA